jgi:phytoene desaturase
MSQSLADERVMIVGAGFGGLSTACHLADAGADVSVLEQNERLGGVADRIDREGFRFDTGPSWYLMPDTFERFFGRFGREPEEYYELTRLDPNYQVFWKDGDSATVPADREGQLSLFDSIEEGAGDALERYLEEAAEAYDVGMEKFVYEARPRWRDWVDPELLGAARGLTLLGTIDEHVADYVDHPKLRQLLEYTLVFLGGRRFITQALYSLMSHVDMNMGVYYPTGGIRSVVEGIVTLARELGVEFHTQTEVTGIEPMHEGMMLSTDSGKRVADRVVANAPPSHVGQELLPPGQADHDAAHWEDQTYAPSAFMLYLGIEGELPELEHHTLVLPTDWTAHFASIFDDPAWPEDPSYYVNVPSRTDDTVAPAGHETMVVLVPIAPGLSDDADRRQAFRDQVLSDIETHTGAELRENIVFEESACVSEFSEYGYPQGTALGLAHTLRQTGPFRTSHRSSTVDGLYYTGSFTAPGIGIPMCLISGEHTAQAVETDVAGSLSTLPPLGLRSD